MGELARGIGHLDASQHLFDDGVHLVLEVLESDVADDLVVRVAVVGVLQLLVDVSGLLCCLVSCLVVLGGVELLCTICRGDEVEDHIVPLVAQNDRVPALLVFVRRSLPMIACHSSVGK